MAKMSLARWLQKVRPWIRDEPDVCKVCDAVAEVEVDGFPMCRSVDQEHLAHYAEEDVELVPERGKPPTEEDLEQARNRALNGF